MRYKTPLLCSFLLLAGCDTIIVGPAQEVTVQTNPPGANCTLTRNDVPLGTVSPTPGTVYLEKTKDDLTVKCSKAGYATATAVNKSGYPKDNWIYILVGGPVGWGVDSASGADNYYTSPFTVDLKKN